MRSLSRLSFPAICVLACIVSVSTIGCDSGPKVHKVSGLLTHNGTPVPNVGVQFSPVDGSRPSHGRVDENGRFAMMYSGSKAGVLEGEHVVHVVYEPATPEEEEAFEAGQLKFSGVLKEVIAKYGSEQSSPYRITVDGRLASVEIKLD